MTPRKKLSPDEHTLPLLDEPGGIAPDEIKVKSPTYPVWTENKAKLIQRYLQYFVFITKHGTYIDGFAGPQERAFHDMWTAKLVLESQPRWLRHFFLCDADPDQVGSLESLRKGLAPRKRGEPRRNIEIFSGDFNEKVDQVLSSGVITEKEAAFALLDQRTFECQWQTVAKLAAHKKQGNKIELLYFLPIKWLHRSISGLKDPEPLDRWWGHDSWRDLAKANTVSISRAFCERVRSVFDYRSVMPWAIHESETGGAVMYYLIHATDHPEAPKLMSRAYRKANMPLEPQEQLRLLLATEDGVDQGLFDSPLR